MKYLLLFLVLSLALLTACNKTAEATPPPKKQIVQVQTTKLATSNKNTAIHAIGKLQSGVETALSFKVGGVIKRIAVQEGKVFRKNQVLAELYPEEVNAKNQQASLAIEQAGLSIKNAELMVNKAQQDYDDAFALYKDSVVTRDKLDNADLQLKNAKNQLTAAQANKKIYEENSNIAEFNVRYAQIRAPYSGVLLKRMAEENELIGAGMPLLYVGSRDDAWKMKVNVTDREVVNLQVGNEAHLFFDAYANDTLLATVDQIANLADPYTGTFEIVLSVKKSEKALISGLLGKADIFPKQAQQQILIPIEAIQYANEKEATIFEIREGKAFERRIPMAGLQGDYVVCMDLSLAGLLIATEGSAKLRHGGEVGY